MLCFCSVRRGLIFWIPAVLKFRFNPLSCSADLCFHDSGLVVLTCVRRRGQRPILFSRPLNSLWCWLRSLTWDACSSFALSTCPSCTFPAHPAPLTFQFAFEVYLPFPHFVLLFPHLRLFSPMRVCSCSPTSSLPAPFWGCFYSQSSNKLFLEIWSFPGFQAAITCSCSSEFKKIVALNFFLSLLKNFI